MPGDGVIDDVSDIADYYNSDPAREQHRLDGHQLEFDLTWRYLQEHLPARAAILEVGAATGRYTLALAERGHTITAVDISAVLLEQCARGVAAAGLGQRVKLVHADARDLSAVTDSGFDAALLMGPLYHLVHKADRLQALAEVRARLRPGGTLFSTFISRFGILGDLMQNLPHWIEDRQKVASFLRFGRRPEDSPPGGFRGYFALADEIPPLHEEAGFETILLAGVEPAISADDRSYNRLQGQQRRLWLDLLYDVSQEPSIIAASRHLLYIGRKT